ncbi:hypothetical protein [Mycoplasma phocimorsus]|uniref:hypothetical protein n=1 Tax=Mycoplasma phocimorsus TaxID=3045839 RepID=UPI0024BF64B1|nr:hypothetical protein [Mycoplasma phocimorsus]MDJ1648980.1 hypothetical protein [Mycoplasma phocimorsus]
MKQNIPLNYKEKLKKSLNKSNIILICVLQIIFILSFIAVWFIQKNREELLIRKFENMFSIIAILSLCFLFLITILKVGFMPSIISKIKKNKAEKYIKTIKESSLSEIKREMLLKQHQVKQSQEKYWVLSFWFIFGESFIFLLIAIILRIVG